MQAYDRAMTDDERQREGNDALADGPAATASRLRLVAPLEDSAEYEEEEGGDPVCWAHLVCEECGAITTEGHRDWCSR